MKRWLSVVGIGEDGMEALTPASRALIEQAEVLFGGDRHLAMLPLDKRQRIAWGNALAQTLARVEAFRGTPVCVLASGDPFDYGVASALARRTAANEMMVIPAPGAVSLACARMGWSRPDTETLTLHGRPLAVLNLHIRPKARLLILSEDGGTPLAVARHLTDQGFGDSPMSALERMGGPAENRRDGIAATWPAATCADLNTIAVECRSGPGARIVPRAAGLPEDLFEHDGQITKRHVRAATIAALAPLPGQVLWDVGAGAGSVAIEWLRAELGNRALAIESNIERCAMIARNAEALGVPQLQVIAGSAPEVLTGLTPSPDSIFLGGGVSAPGVLEFSWDILPPGGRLVANAVSLAAEVRMIAFCDKHGGELVRMAISNLDWVGPMTVMRPAMPVLQYVGVKP